ncbi:MAG TPA: efflux RND transporter periplasmic adaptor subunit [Anaeromyxobacteraceae bacterium]|nr:efflux RND transporter periplasmic adaptor subunit [Anaeromyxobacteraceae bacterium]
MPAPDPALAPPEAPPAAPVLSSLPPPARMSTPRRIAAALAVLAAAAVVTASLRPRPEPPVGIHSAPARRGPITRLVTAAGKLAAATEVKLSSNISGDLLALEVKEGDRVHRGQTLGRIDSRRYDEQVRQQDALRASVAADVELERVRVAQLEAELGRVLRLASSDNASAAEVDTARANLDAERARRAAAEQRVAQAEAALREARHLQSLTVLVAPIDGVVTKREKQVGERVRGSDLGEDVIVVVSTLSKMEVKVEVGEHEVVYVKEGDPADVEIDAFPDRKFPAQVIEVARNATVKNAGTEAETTTFYVRMALATPVPGALPGMSAEATVSTDTREDAVVVPIQAVTVRAQKDLAGGAAADPPAPQPAGRKARREPMRKIVFVMENGVARPRPVETGLASDTEIEIVSGLAAGERVIDGPYRVVSKELADGKRVKEEEPPGAGAGEKR